MCCGRCGAGVWTLFFKEMNLVCRDCAKLGYISQQRPSRSAEEQALAILAELGAPPLLTPKLPSRPDSCEPARYERSRIEHSRRQRREALDVDHRRFDCR
jgi:hypothetical protein